MQKFELINRKKNKVSVSEMCYKFRLTSETRTPLRAHELLKDYHPSIVFRRDFALEVLRVCGFRDRVFSTNEECIIKMEPKIKNYIHYLLMNDFTPRFLYNIIEVTAES